MRSLLLGSPVNVHLLAELLRLKPTPKARLQTPLLKFNGRCDATNNLYGGENSGDMAARMKIDENFSRRHDVQVYVHVEKPREESFNLRPHTDLPRC